MFTITGVLESISYQTLTSPLVLFSGGRELLGRSDVRHHWGPGIFRAGRDEIGDREIWW